MQIAIPSLRQGRHVMRSLLPAGAYGETAARTGLDFRSDIAVEAVVTKMGEDVLVQAKVSAAVAAECARCMAPFVQELSAAFAALFVPEGAESATRSATAQAEVEGHRVCRYSGVVDIGDQIIESLYLAVPMKLLCKAECRGLCQRCGKNLNDGQCDCAPDEQGYRPFAGLHGL